MTTQTSTTRIYERGGKAHGHTTGGARACGLRDGCSGECIGVRWHDGEITYPCTAGMLLRDDGMRQIR